MQPKRQLHWFIFITLLSVISCAKQTSPTGGPKDTIPPKLISSNPPLEAINFKGNSLSLEFTEMIIANNSKEQLIITPSIGKDFEVKTKKNSVTIDFGTTLEDSTTYTFNFRDAIQDITEKNPVRNLQVAFSTGPYIDSLSIKGKVYDLLKAKEIKDATVAIHIPNDTFSILKHPATFFTKTDEKGNFIISHLKPGQYYLYAMDDKNRNLVADSRTESYGFRSAPITLTKDSSDLTIGLVRLDSRPLKVTSARPYNTYFNIRTSKNLKSFEFAASDSSKLLYSFGEDQSNVRIYKTLNTADSISVRFIGKDSINNISDTTVYVKFLTREVIPEKFESTLSSTSIIAASGELNLNFSFTKPIKQVVYDSIFFLADTLNKIPITEKDLIWNYPQKKLLIKKTLDKKLFEPKSETKQVASNTDSVKSQKTPTTKIISNQLYIGKGTFISADNDSSKSLTQTITPLKPEDLSKIIFNIGTEHKNFLVQLIDNNYNVIKQIEDKPKGEFTDLNPGNYMMRVIIDSNDNNVWDPGNYQIKEEPEKVYYYKDEKNSNTVNLKANWDFELAPMLITD